MKSASAHFDSTREERETLRNLLRSLLVDKTPDGEVKEFPKDIEMLERLCDEGTPHEEVDRQWARLLSEKHREGRVEGRVEERVLRLASQRRLVGLLAASRFGEDETAWLAELLAGIDDPDLIDSIGSMVGECGSAAELEERIRAL